MEQVRERAPTLIRLERSSVASRTTSTSIAQVCSDRGDRLEGSGSSAQVLGWSVCRGAELGRRVPGPARVGEHAPRQRDHVGLSGGDDLLRLTRLRDEPHGDRRDARGRPDRRGELHLIPGTDRQRSGAARYRRSTRRSSRPRAVAAPRRTRASGRCPSPLRPSRSPRRERPAGGRRARCRGRPRRPRAESASCAPANLRRRRPSRFAIGERNWCSRYP